MDCFRRHYLDNKKHLHKFNDGNLLRNQLALRPTDYQMGIGRKGSEEIALISTPYISDHSYCDYLYWLLRNQNVVSGNRNTENVR